MKLHEVYKKIQELESKKDEIPWKVWTTFWDEYPEHYGVFGDQISFSRDFKSLKEMQESTEWLVKQFGGTVKWK